MQENTVKDLLFAISEETRLRIMLLLDGSTLCVNCLVDSLKMPQPTVSRHLALLRRTGVVETRKEKLHCYYTLSSKPADELIQKLTRLFHGHLGGIEPFKSDYTKALKLNCCCSAGCKVKKRVSKRRK